MSTKLKFFAFIFPLLFVTLFLISFPNYAFADDCTEPSACNYGASDTACDFESCRTCQSPETGDYPNCGTCSGSLTGTYPYCTCSNGADVPDCVQSCSNGETGNYPDCGTCSGSTTGIYPNCTCVNGASNAPTCDDGTCPNGAIDFDTCSDCGSGKTMVNGTCTNDPVCPSGTSGTPPACTCDNTATNPPTCTVGDCPNGAIDFDTCADCGANADMVNGSCVPKSCPSGTSGTYPSCTCTNGSPNVSDGCACPLGQEEVEGYCINVCPSGTTRDSEGDCQCDNGASDAPTCTESLCKDTKANNYNDDLPCTYDHDSCCSVEAAKNTDPDCPDFASDPQKIADDLNACQYCQKGDPEFECEEDYCDSSEYPDATNGETLDDCDQANPDRTCTSFRNVCEWPQIYFCPDTTTPAINGETQADCDASIPSYYNPCDPDGKCNYPSEYYCGDADAINYDAGGADCTSSHPTGTTCTENDGTCEYEYCTLDFSLDVKCPNSGFEFKTPPDQSYVFSYPLGAGETCEENLSYEEEDSLSSYFMQKYCGTGDSTACQGGFCGQIDWCPGVTDPNVDHTDPTQCGVDACPGVGDPGIQTSESQCTTTQVDGVCGSVDKGHVLGQNYIAGSYACESGTRSTVSSANNQFNWTCNGTGGGINAQCSATLSCDNGETDPNKQLTYCNGQCLTKSQLNSNGSCDGVKVCGAGNLNFCIDEGNVSLSNKIDVTPLINKEDGKCTVNIDSENAASQVFDGYNADTHCALYSQDGLVLQFDPKYVGNTDPELGPIVSKTITQAGVTKDMLYTLKCYDGPTPPTDDSGYEIAKGACRLNIKTKEAN
ncbi:MAG: hypothetical protein V4509_05315 [Patescibacteria group bacterium]